MTLQTENKIVVEKTLHMENVQVRTMAYTSLTRPALTEIAVTTDGKYVLRLSEDNGRTWTAKGAWEPEVEKAGGRTVMRHPPEYYLEPDHGILVEFSCRYELGESGDYASFGPEQDGSPPQARTGRVFYRISRDEGATWEPQKQIVQHGPGYDEVHWAQGICYGKNSAFAMTPTRLRDGTIILPLEFSILGSDGEMIKWPDRFGAVMWPVGCAACLVGRWRKDMSEIDWEMSNHVTVPEPVSRGLAEPAVTEMDNGVLMMVVRGDSTPCQSMPSVKFFSISNDRGMTWGPVVPLTYPNSNYVYSPASYLSFFRSVKNDRTYLITNILSGPTKQCDPRYPLNIIEIDRTYLWALPETNTIIEDRQKRHGKLIRFSNWRLIEDRESGNPVLYMTEGRADAIIPDPEEAPTVPDSYRYKIQLPE